MTKSKRKVNINQGVTEPLSKVPKTDEAVVQDNLKFPLENMTKSVLLKFCKELKLKYDNLVDQNRILTMKNKALEEQEDNFKYCCSECDFESNCVHCFGDHDHDEPENEQESQSTKFTCYYCEDTFQTKADVMKHTKLIHLDKVSHCLNFLEGTCSFSDRCWFLHDENMRKSEPIFDCKFCESRFKTKSQLMKHKKLCHIDSVSKCSNYDKKCKYGSEKCWFLHKEDIEKAFEIAQNVNIDMNRENNMKNTNEKPCK